MKPKKNPKKDLTRKRGLYFIIGLVFLLALLYAALEWKTPIDDGGYDLGAPLEDFQQHRDSSVVLETKATKSDSIKN